MGNKAGTRHHGARPSNVSIVRRVCAGVHGTVAGDVALPGKTCHGRRSRIFGGQELLHVPAQRFAGPAILLRQAKHSALIGRRQSRDHGMGGPGKVGTPVLGGHSAGHRLIPLQHLARDPAFARLRKGLAKLRISSIQQITNPPRTRPLTPQRELQGADPILDVPRFDQSSRTGRKQERSKAQCGR